MAKNAKGASRDSYVGIPQSARAEVKEKLKSFRTMASPETVYQVMQETAKAEKRKEEAEKARALRHSAQEERVKLSPEGRAEIRTAMAKVYARMSDISLHVGLLKAGVDGELPVGHIDENDLQEVCARAAFIAIDALHADVSNLQDLFDLGDEPLGDEIRAAKMKEWHA